MAWSNAVITNSGLAILPQLIVGDQMDINGAEIASGTVEEVSLITQTSLSSPINDIHVVIADSSVIDNGIAIKLQIRNTGLTSAKTFKQIGLYATYNDSKVLFAIAQDDIGEEIPSVSDYPDYMLEFTMAVAVSQTDGITVTVNPSAVVTAEMLDKRLAKLTETMNTAINGVPKLFHTEAKPAATGPWIWLQPVRRTELDAAAVVLELSTEEAQNGGVVVAMDGTEYTVENASTDPNDVGEGEYLFDIENN